MSKSKQVLKLTDLPVASIRLFERTWETSIIRLSYEHSQEPCRNISWREEDELFISHFSVARITQMQIEVAVINAFLNA